MIDRDFNLKDHDLYLEAFKLAAQIPPGKVSTYGAIAKALGDISASRAVGQMMSADRVRPFFVPCHRVIYSDGRIGWYCGMGKGMDRKRELLRSEGVRIEDDKVMDLERHLFTDFRGERMLARMAEEQRAIARCVEPWGDATRFGRIAALDVSYEGDTAHAAMVVMDRAGAVLEERTCSCTVNFPYVPGYLGFREMRPYSMVMGQPSEGTLYLIDGHGWAHPRRAGVACQFGVVNGVAAAGVAKTILTGAMKGDSLVLDGQEAGRLCRTMQGRTYFISIGHKVDLESVSRVISSLTEDPMVMAHKLATRSKRSGA